MLQLSLSLCHSSLYCNPELWLSLRTTCFTRCTPQSLRKINCPRAPSTCFRTLSEPPSFTILVVVFFFTKDVGPKNDGFVSGFVWIFFFSSFFLLLSIKISKIFQRNRNVDLTRENFIRVLMQHHQPTGLNESCRITTVLSNSQSSLSYSSRRFYSCKLSLTSSAGQLNPLLDKTTMHFILRTQPPESGYVSLSVSHLVFNIASGVMNFRRNP